MRVGRAQWTWTWTLRSRRPPPPLLSGLGAAGRGSRSSQHSGQPPGPRGLILRPRPSRAAGLAQVAPPRASLPSTCPGASAGAPLSCPPRNPRASPQVQPPRTRLRFCSDLRRRLGQHTCPQVTQDDDRDVLKGHNASRVFVLLSFLPHLLAFVLLCLYYGHLGATGPLCLICAFGAY